MSELISFASDNHSGVHPLLFAEMEKVNQLFAPSYGQDPWSQQLKAKVLREFQADDCAMVFNGTAANVLCLQLGLKTYESVLCSEVAHLHVDECGAPEKIAGVKLLCLPTENGKIKIEALGDFLLRRGDQHHSHQPQPEYQHRPLTALPTTTMQDLGDADTTHIIPAQEGC